MSIVGQDFSSLVRALTVNIFVYYCNYITYVIHEKKHEFEILYEIIHENFLA